MNPSEFSFPELDEVGIDTLDASGLLSTDFLIFANSDTHVTLTEISSGDGDELFFVENLVFDDTTLMI